MFRAHLDQHLAHVMNILLLGSSGSRTGAEVPSNTETVRQHHTCVCTHTHTMQKQYKIIAKNRTCSRRVWQNGGISVEEMHSPSKLAGPLFSMHTGQLEERNFPLSGLSYKGKWHANPR